MIRALHKAGIGVVLDVVYNHTFHRNSWLQRTAPGEYYREDAQGRPMNASGCGNETASEREPFRNYMLQSILYWATEYHVDGFRFDLMGVHDVETMNLIRDALDQLPDGRSILMYGEPWSALPPAIQSPALPAGKHNARMLNERIGVFSDKTRNTLIGNAFDPLARGIALGNLGGTFTADLKSCICGLSRADLDP